MVTAGLVLSACASAGTSAQRSAEPATASLTSVATPSRASSARELPPAERAHAIVIQATSCWLGGLWSDAVGEAGAARDAGIRRRCDDLLRAVGESPEAAYYPLRALDAGTVDRIADRVRQAAIADERDAAGASALVGLLHEIAGASRETVRARRAADQVKQDYAAMPAGDRRADKLAAAPEIRRAESLRALLEHRGPYAKEAHIIGTLHAIDRMEIARGLPKHLKIYAVEGAYLDTFGVPAPQLSADAAAPIPTGTWLAYLGKVAAAAGHPVPADARSPQNREPLAWNGVLEGFADKLRDVHTESSLDAVARSIVARIDQQAARARAAFEAHAAGDR